MRSTTVAVTSIWRSIGHKLWRAQTADKKIAEKFTKIAKDLSDNEKTIDQELLAAQGKPQDVGGYYHPDDAKAFKAMRPSATLNKIIDSFA